MGGGDLRLKKEGRAEKMTPRDTRLTEISERTAKDDDRAVVSI
jgi:hypothetical protein